MEKIGLVVAVVRSKPFLWTVGVALAAWIGFSALCNVFQTTTNISSGGFLGELALTTGRIAVDFPRQDFSEISNELLIEKGLIPERWLDGDKIKHPWGGDMIFSPGGPRTFMVEFRDFDEAACAAFTARKGPWVSASCANGGAILFFQ